MTPTSSTTRCATTCFSLTRRQTTHAWVQHPVGYRVLENGNIELDNYWAVLLNSWMCPQYAHNMGGAVVCGAFVMAGLGAFYVLGRRHEEYGRIFLKIGVITSSGCLPVPSSASTRMCCPR